MDDEHLDRLAPGARMIAANAGPRAVIVACIGSFTAALSTSLVAIAAPVMARDLHATPADVAWVLTAYLLAISCLLAAAGRLADLFGRRRVYLAGFCVFGAASVACGLSPTLRWLVGARVVQGVGAAALMATGPAIVTQAFPPARRARALGIQLAATYLGLTLGPTLGGALAAALGWHAVFFAVAAAAATGAAAAGALLPHDASAAHGASGPPAPRPGERLIRGLDLGGSAWLAFGLAAVLLALRRGGTPSAARVLALGALGAGAFAALVRHEARHPSPMLPPALARSPAFAFGVAGAMLLFVVTFVLAFLLPFELQRERGMNAAHAGLLMSAQPATTALVAPGAGWLADRFGARAPATAGMVALAAGLALVAYAAPASAGSAGASEASIVLGLVVVGLGAGLYVAPNNAVIMAAAPRDRQGTAAAMAATARNVGMACGVALAIVLADAVGFRGALLAAAALALGGAALGAVRPS